jgi:hypothetical protein
MRDRTDSTIGAAHRDREWAAKASQMQPVMWTGIAMMTIIAAVLGYFGWWTKAALAVVVGAGMIVLAQTLPEHGTAILLAGLGVFGLIALLVLYANHKGQLDKDRNGIPRAALHALRCAALPDEQVGHVHGQIGAEDCRRRQM